MAKNLLNIFEKLDETLPMSIGDAVKNVSRAAKDRLYVQRELKKITEYGDSAYEEITHPELVDRLSEKLGVFPYARNNKNVGTKCELGFMCKDDFCKHHKLLEEELELIQRRQFEGFAEGIFFGYVSSCENCVYKTSEEFTYKEPDMRKVDAGIKSLREEADALYDLKSKVGNLACWKIEDYKEIYGKLYKVVNIFGYLPHIPVNEEERTKIENGEIEIQLEDRKSGVFDVPDDDLNTAKKILNEILKIYEETSYEKKSEN